MDIPLIRKFECGYEQGAARPTLTIEVFQNMTGTTGAAWNDPVRGGELTKNQIDQGADVIYAAAGATGLGVLQTAADNKKLDRRRFEPELPASGLGPDLDGQARRSCGLQRLCRRQG
jgi:basic membrane lipoprotein Med (substrate-binding protein (PBP1-ABC) superfamily)